MRFARFNRAAQGFFIHKAVHQEFATFEIGCDRGYQPAIIKFWGKFGAFFNLFDCGALCKGSTHNILKFGLCFEKIL